MTLDELVGKVSEDTKITKKLARDVVHAAFAHIEEAVSTGDKILIPNLGRFSSKDRKARKGSNPSTGEKVEIAARKVPTFSYTGKVKERVGELPIA